MPELPEVETLKTQIKENFLGNRLIDVNVIDERASTNPERLLWLKDKKLINVSRRGKTLIIQFEQGLTALVHLMISGRAFMTDPNDETPKGTMVCLIFDNRSLCFTYLHLGFIEIYKDSEVAGRLSYYGPEALEIGIDEFAGSLSRSKRSIKAFLLDQRMIAGIGNIYADEILYCAKISPLRSSNSLGKKEIAELFSCMNEILKNAVQKRGTTIVSWEDLYGNKGEFQEHLKIVAKEDASCSGCGQKFTKRKVAGRATYFCPSCQR